MLWDDADRAACTLPQPARYPGFLFNPMGAESEGLASLVDLCAWKTQAHHRVSSSHHFAPRAGCLAWSASLSGTMCSGVVPGRVLNLAQLPLMEQAPLGNLREAVCTSCRTPPRCAGMATPGRVYSVSK